MKPTGASPAWVTRAWKKSTEVKTLPISTVNITGFFIMCRGSSFQNESLTAFLRSGPERRDTDRVWLEVLGASMAVTPTAA